jgi:Tfp pilus assembly protein PilX
MGPHPRGASGAEPRRSTQKLPTQATKRQGERGAAIFIVVMVLTMLTAVGVFAIRAASLAEAASGYDRQNTQNHYVGEYGLHGAVTELSSPRRDWYYNQMKKGAEPCTATKGITSAISTVPLRSRRVTLRPA